MIKGDRAPGRPYFKADIPLQVIDPLSTLRGDFYSIVSKLTYGKLIALARAFGVTERTAYAWRYGEHTPSYSTMMHVIDWARRGKPMSKHYQDPHHGQMF